MLLPAETSAAWQITTCGYERIKFELRFKRKAVFSNFQPHSYPWGEGGPTGSRPGIVVIMFGDAISPKIDSLAMNRIATRFHLQNILRK
jgi:hypothetical protein